MRKTLICLSIFALACATQASAQRYMMRGPNGEPLSAGVIVVQAQRGMSLPKSADVDAAKQREEAVRMLYRMADRECALLLETIAADCSLAQVNTSVSVGEDSAQMIRANGNFSMKIRLKGDPVESGDEKK